MVLYRYIYRLRFCTSVMLDGKLIYTVKELHDTWDLMATYKEEDQERDSVFGARQVDILLTLHGEVSAYTRLMERCLSTKNLSLVITEIKMYLNGLFDIWL